MNTVTGATDRRLGPTVKHVERTLTALTLGATPLSEQVIAATIRAHRSRRLTGPRPGRRQIRALYALTAGSTR